MSLLALSDALESAVQRRANTTPPSPDSHLKREELASDEVVKFVIGWWLKRSRHASTDRDFKTLEARVERAIAAALQNTDTTPAVAVELYGVRDGIMDFVIQNKSGNTVIFDYAAVRLALSGCDIRGRSNYISTRTSIGPHCSFGGIIFEPVLPNDVKDDDVVSVDFSRSISVCRNLAPITARVADIKRRTCQP